MTVSATQVAQMKTAVGHMMGDSVSVKTRTGQAGRGPVYGTAATVTCNRNSSTGSTRLLQNTDGEQVAVQEVFEVKAADASKFTPGSEVTVDSRKTTVLATNPVAYGGQMVYLEVSCG